MRNGLLDSLLIQNFKCFTDLQLRFGKLTLLCGHNGAGKSTSYQPILLLRQAMHELLMVSETPRRKRTEKGIGRNWPLNGELIRLGTTGDVLNHKYDSSNIRFHFEWNNGTEIPVKLFAEKGESHLRRTSKMSNLYPLNFNSRLVYISAERRVSPFYPMPDRNFDPNFGVGNDGRFSCFLYEEQCKKDRSFRKQVDRWLGYVVPEAKALVQKLPGAPLFSLKFKLSNSTEFMSPVNVGYGITYAFSIIVALLTATKGDFIIIDSPEAHLHPRAQSNFGRVIAQFAARGVQIVLETHSDHVVNGIRLAVIEKSLKPNDLNILFFSGATHRSHGVVSVNVDKRGDLSEWPIGFFDQIAVDSLEIIRNG